MSDFERPILFSAPMVRAILEGRKTQTRRVVKLTDTGCVKEPRSPRNWHPEDPDAVLARQYGSTGDRLWVRENFSYPRVQGVDPTDCGIVWYWADGNPEYGDWSRPKPSIHMPRWASRITLEITGIRIERLWEISEEDATAEGIGQYQNGTFGLDDPGACMGTTAVVAYMRLWNHINGQGSWDLNPWVWVIEFAPRLPAPNATESGDK